MPYEPVIGLEIHCELETRSKVFCGDATTFGAPPNTQTCPVSLGMPGSLPVLNQEAFELALRFALACHCQVPGTTWFDRKNYYYPDLPKNYQISQNYEPVGLDGYVEIPYPEGEVRKIGILNIHLEEDAGKLIHPELPELRGTTLVDLNRAGMPLLEIVTAPDIRTVEEAEVFMHTMRSLLRYTEVSDCKMQQGHLRFEINISMRPVGQQELPDYRVEIKNLGSIKIALKCIEHEMARQKDLLEEGRPVEQETRLWDEEREVTRAMRKKEEAHDYRYFPEPDLPPIHITQDWLDRIRETIPELQNEKRERFVDQYGIPHYDAGVLVDEKPVADYYEKVVELGADPKKASNWVMTEILRELRDREMEIDDCPVTPPHLSTLIQMIDKGTISGKIAKEVFADMMESGKDPEAIVREKGLVQMSDTGELEALVDAAIAANPKAFEQYRQGKERAKGAIVGYIMKETRGKANPQLVNELIDQKAGNV